MMVKGLVHIGLTVFDLDTMLDFYTRVLGMTVDCEVPHPRGGTIVFLRSAEGEAIEMIRLAEPRPPGPRDRDRTGLHHFGLRVDDIHAEYGRLAGLGVDLDGEIKVNTSNDLVFHLWDPENNRIHLTQVRE